jgi:hypothetical protein
MRIDRPSSLPIASCKKASKSASSSQKGVMSSISLWRRLWGVVERESPKISILHENSFSSHVGSFCPIHGDLSMASSTLELLSTEYLTHAHAIFFMILFPPELVGSISDGRIQWSKSLFVAWLRGHASPFHLIVHASSSSLIGTEYFELYTPGIPSVSQCQIPRCSSGSMRIL